MPNLVELGPFTGEGDVQMVVETPRGSTLKLRYDSDRHIFTVSRALALGVSYPFDWGFIPGTRGEDGDPVDGLAIHDGGTYPGVVLFCRLLGMVDVDQKAKKSASGTLA